MMNPTSATTMQVTYYYPWDYFYPARCGAARVAAAHMEYFRSRGMRLRVIVMGSDNARRRVEFERHYDWVDEIAVFYPRRYPEIARLCAAWDFGSFTMGHAAMCRVPEFREVLSKPTDLVFLNYIFSTPFLDVVPKSAVKVLESIDILSKQFHLRHQSDPLLAYQMRTEFEMYSLYDAVLMINEEEARLARTHSSANVAYVPRAVETARHDELLEETSDGTYDLLFVGSDHGPNVEGVNWFYENIFRRHLGPRGIGWAVVGSVCDKLNFTDPAVHVLGSVDDLDAVYRRSKVVVVPLFGGAGISIKVLEAMGRGKPVITTPCGMRGLSAADNQLVCLSFDEQESQLVQRVLELCRSVESRKEYGHNALRYVRDHFSRQVYDQRMDEIIRSLSVTRGNTTRNTLSRVA